MLFEKEKEKLENFLSSEWSIIDNGHRLPISYINAMFQDNIDCINEFNEKLLNDNELNQKITNKINNGEEIQKSDFNDKNLYGLYITSSLYFQDRRGMPYYDLRTECDSCGERFSYLKIDYVNKQIIPLSYKPGYVLEDCKFSNLTSLKTTINVDSDLLFCNFFKQNNTLMFDNISISTINGQKEVTEKNGEIDVLYGQTGNMSVYIYKKGDNLVLLDSDFDYLNSEFNYILKDFCLKNKVSEIVARKMIEVDLEKVKKMPRGEDLVHYHNLLLEFEPYKDWDFKGEVSCEMWRFMASSTSNIKKHNLEIDHWTDEPVVVDMKSGVYELNHYYRVSDKGCLVAEIKLL